MKILSVLSVLCTCFLASCNSLNQIGSRDARNQADIRKIHELEAQWMDALARKDTTAMARILSKDFTISGSAAVKETRQQYLETTVSTPRTLEPIVFADQEIKSYGSIVISTGKVTYKGDSGK